MIKERKYKGIGDISHLSYSEQMDITTNYIKSLLFGGLKDYLDEQNNKLFIGISKRFRKQYMLKFFKLLKDERNGIGVINYPIIIKYKNGYAEEYVSFFTFQRGSGVAFGSFTEAYKYAYEVYMFNHMILGNATIQLGEHLQVFFGRVIIQNGQLVEKDIEKVTNNDFYKILIN